MFDIKPRLVVLLSACLCYLPLASAVMVGQVDDFESGTQGWTAGGFNPAGEQFPPNPPATVAGGPSGDYLVVTSEGGPGGPGSKLTTFNLAQWAGDYTASGVTDITFDAINMGVGDLDLRLMIVATDFTSTVVTTNSESLDAGSGWQNLTFGVEASDFTALGASDIGFVLANAAALRIIHNPIAGVTAAAPPIQTQLGLDNISAVPLPPALTLLLPVAVGVLRRRCASA